MNPERRAFVQTLLAERVLVADSVAEFEALLPQLRGKLSAIDGLLSYYNTAGVLTPLHPPAKAAPEQAIEEAAAEVKPSAPALPPDHGPPPAPERPVEAPETALEPERDSPPNAVAVPAPTAKPAVRKSGPATPRPGAASIVSGPTPRRTDWNKDLGTKERSRDTAEHRRVLAALTRSADADGLVSLKLSEIAARSNTLAPKVSQVIPDLLADHAISIVVAGSGDGRVPATYRITKEASAS